MVRLKNQYPLTLYARMSLFPTGDHVPYLSWSPGRSQ